MGGTVAAPTPGTNPSSYAVVTDMDRLYANLDEFQFSPNPRTPQYLGTGSSSENFVDTCRFFLTAHSKAPELNMFNLPRVSIWPLWNPTTNTTGNAYSPNNTVLDSAIQRCATVNTSGTAGGAGGNPHQMCFFRSDPTSQTNDYTNISRNQQVYRYLQTLSQAPIPGFGNSFSSKYTVANTNQILAEIFDYIRSTNLNDNSNVNGKAAIPFTNGTGGTSSGPNSSGVGQVVPLKFAPSGGGPNPYDPTNVTGIGRFPTIAELALTLVKVDDRKNPNALESGTNLVSSINVSGGGPNISTVNPKSQTLVEWTLIPRLASPMAGYVAEAENFRIRFSNIKLKIGGQSAYVPTKVPDLYSTGYMGGTRDCAVGGPMGPLSLAMNGGSPSDSTYTSGLVVVSGTTSDANGTPNVVSMGGGDIR